jgi:hypothetical protein
MDPPELASEPPQSRIGAASNSAPHLTPLGWVMLGHSSPCASVGMVEAQIINVITYINRPRKWNYDLV